MKSGDELLPVLIENYETGKRCTIYVKSSDSRDFNDCIYRNRGIRAYYSMV